MLLFLWGFVIGGAIGITLTSLTAAAKDSDKGENRDK